MCDPLPQEVILGLNQTLINVIYVTKMTSTFPEVRILSDHSVTLVRFLRGTDFYGIAQKAGQPISADLHKSRVGRRVPNGWADSPLHIK